MATSTLEKHLKERLLPSQDYELHGTLLEFFNRYHSGDVTVDPSNVLNILCRLNPRLIGKKQEDAQEVLALVLVSAKEEQRHAQGELKAVEHPSLLTVFGSVFGSILATRSRCQDDCSNM